MARHINNKPRVFITNPNIPGIAVDILSQTCDVIVSNEMPAPNRQQILSKLSGIDAIIWSSKEFLDGEILNGAGSQLRVISTTSSGLDHVDIDEIKSRGIKLGHTPKVIDGSVANVAVLLTLAATRRLHEGRLLIENGKWTFGIQQMLGQEIEGSTIGVVGLGSIGQAIIKRLKPFEVGRFLYSGHAEKAEGRNLGAEFVPFDVLLKDSDVVIASCPLTPETTEMFNQSAFQKMKKTAVFINIGRGGLVDQEALIDALEQETIFAAGLDVMSPEPLPTDNKLLTLPNCILLPHIGTSTMETRNKMAELAARNILAGLEGRNLPAPAF